MNLFFKTHFPSSRANWNGYFRVFLPIILGAFFYALNGVVDNFMVGHINQAQPALGSINSWTGILMGYFAGTAAAGSVAIAQFYHAKKFKVVKELARLRYLLCLSLTIFVAMIAWIKPELLAETFLKGDHSSAQYTEALDNAVKYARIIAIQWILISISYNISNQLREIGYGKEVMYLSIGGLVANISLNSILMYGIHLGVEGAAWASVAGRLIVLFGGIIVIVRQKLEIGFQPHTLFNISWNTFKIFWHRWLYFTSIFTVNTFIVFRNMFYSIGYPNNGSETLGSGISGMAIVALAGALINVFTVTFDAMTSMASNFVGSELGKGNIEQAKKNAKEIKGFMTLNGLVLSLLLVAFSFVVPYMNFLSDSKNPNFDNKTFLLQVSRSLLVIALFYPIWIWFVSSYRMASAGGKGKLFAILDWILSGPVQIGWVAFIALVIIPHSPLMQKHFFLTYLLFYTSDLLKLVAFEILFYKREWAFSIVQDDIVVKNYIASK